MNDSLSKHSLAPCSIKHCVIIGASHAGVNAAFDLRKNGWQGKISLIDADPHLPYHRPPLSKTYLKACAAQEIPCSATESLKPLKAELAYQQANIELKLGIKVVALDPKRQQLQLQSVQSQAALTGDPLQESLNDGWLSYDKLILAIGAQPLIPPIAGLSPSQLNLSQEQSQVFTLRHAHDVQQITKALAQSESKRVLIIGGGYIGLETAASLSQLGAQVTLLERESRLLARVSAAAMSAYFTQLHQQHGVNIHTNEQVIAINQHLQVSTQAGNHYQADLIVLGVGISIDPTLINQANLKWHQGLGIEVNQNNQTSDPNLYAIGDCCVQFHPRYQQWLRLESVQNATEQAKTVARHLTMVPTPDVTPQPLPWFWSDQFDTKLQIVGINQGYTHVIERIEAIRQTPQVTDKAQFSLWYFKDKQLIAVDAVNHAKAYVVATKLLKAGTLVDQKKLPDQNQALTVENLQV